MAMQYPYILVGDSLLTHVTMDNPQLPHTTRQRYDMIYAIVQRLDGSDG